MDNEIVLPAAGSAEEEVLTEQLVRQTAYRVNVHLEHDWVKRGRCFYCHPCDERRGPEALIGAAVEQGLVASSRFALAPL